jgi:hypothetical protein
VVVIIIMATPRATFACRARRGGGGRANKRAVVRGQLLTSQVRKLSSGLVDLAMRPGSI